MQIFIDSANLDQISELHTLNIATGVTTNPSLMAKEGIIGEANWHKHYITICKTIKAPTSAEVIATDYDEMLSEAKHLASLHANIVVKIPITKAGLQVISKLNSLGIKTNCTLIFTTPQALLAAKAGATYVSPFIGRLNDIGEDGLGLIKSIRTIFDNYQFETKILAASIRSQEQVNQCALLGADVITAPYSILSTLIDHQLTDKGLKQFLADHAKLNKIQIHTNGKA
jgi:transaldolase